MDEVMNLLEVLYDTRRDLRNKAIIDAIFKHQYEIDKRGIQWGELFNSVENCMAYDTFAKRLRELKDIGLVEAEAITGQRGNPTLYRLNPKLYALLIEIMELINPEHIKNEIEKFEKSIEKLDTENYVAQLMELAQSRITLLPISMMFFKTEATWAFYEQNYQNLEQILNFILNRASKNRVSKEQTLNILFTMLKPFSESPIGKHFDLDEVYNEKQKLRQIILEK